MYRTCIDVFVMLRAFTLFVAACLLVCSSALASPETSSKRVGNYEVHYSAFNTSFLAPDVAAALNIVRAKDRALINVSVREYLPGGGDREVAVAAIEGSTFNLLHRRPLEFIEVKERGAIYYIAEFSIQNNNEMIIIDTSIVPATAERAIDISIKRHFFHNE